MNEHQELQHQNNALSRFSEALGKFVIIASNYKHLQVTPLTEKLVGELEASINDVVKLFTLLDQQTQKCWSNQFTRLPEIDTSRPPEERFQTYYRYLVENFSQLLNEANNRPKIQALRKSNPSLSIDF